MTPCNTELGFPRGLRGTRFDAIVLHYSLFGADGADYPFSLLFERLLDCLARRPPTRSRSSRTSTTTAGSASPFLNRHRIDCVYTLLEQPREIDKVYGALTKRPEDRARTCPAT